MDSAEKYKGLPYPYLKRLCTLRGPKAGRWATIGVYVEALVKDDQGRSYRDWNIILLKAELDHRGLIDKYKDLPGDEIAEILEEDDDSRPYTPPDPETTQKYDDKKKKGGKHEKGQEKPGEESGEKPEEGSGEGEGDESGEGEESDLEPGEDDFHSFCDEALKVLESSQRIEAQVRAFGKDWIESHTEMRDLEALTKNRRNAEYRAKRVRRAASDANKLMAAFTDRTKAAVRGEADEVAKAVEESERIARLCADLVQKMENYLKGSFKSLIETEVPHILSRALDVLDKDDAARKRNEMASWTCQKTEIVDLAFSESQTAYELYESTRKTLGEILEEYNRVFERFQHYSANKWPGIVDDGAEDTLERAKNAIKNTADKLSKALQHAQIAAAAAVTKKKERERKDKEEEERQKEEEEKRRKDEGKGGDGEGQGDEADTDDGYNAGLDALEMLKKYPLQMNNVTLSENPFSFVHHDPVQNGKAVDAIIHWRTTYGALFISFPGRNPDYPKVRAGAIVPVAQCRPALIQYSEATKGKIVITRDGGTFKHTFYLHQFELILLGSAPESGKSTRYPRTIVLGRFEGEEFSSLFTRSSLCDAFGKRQVETLFAKQRERDGSPHPRAAMGYVLRAKA